MKPLTEFEQSLSSLMESTITRYRGLIIDKVGKEFKVLGHTFSDVWAAKKYVDESYINLKNSIK